MVGLALAGRPVQAAPAGQEQDRTGEQEAGGLLTVELRVISTGPGPLVTVDRGESDALAEGDVVLFHLRHGGVLSGSVGTVNRRSATVELHDPAVLPEPGTHGEVRVPRQRLIDLAARRRAEREAREAERAVPRRAPPPEEAETGAAELPQEPVGEGESYWRNLDREYEQGMPLLAEIGMVRPDEREPRVTGRAWVAGDHVLTSDDGRDSGFYRAGAAVDYEDVTLFGHRGDLSFAGELTYKRVDLPDEGVDDGTHLRIERLSYRLGGTRFERDRHELGRFLQHDMPEFGLLDGYAWGRRTDEGHRFGFSAGFMPEPDPDLESGHDFQLAAWYRWVSDLSERLSASLGYQKSWHDGAADRDLVVGKFHHLPLEGWQLQGTAWLDVYSSGDDAKGSGVGLTQAWLSARRPFESRFPGRRHSVDVTYSHLEFPDIERFEFLLPAPEELEEGRRDRLELGGRRWVRDDQRLLASVGMWIDDDDSGLDGELGYEVVLPRSRAGVTAFGSQAEYVTALGLRGRYAHDLANGFWDVSYELVNQDNLGFADDNDDLVQQRLRGSRQVTTRSGWYLSGYVEADYWEDEQGLTLGFNVQRSF
jgi:hypothetical protein